jgi:hypothetical protein
MTPSFWAKLGVSDRQQGTGLMNEDVLMKHMVNISVGCILATLIMLLPLFGQGLAAVDAVQNEKLSSLEMRVEIHGQTIAAIDSKMNWIIGGIAGIYGTMAVIGFMNMNLLKRK